MSEEQNGETAASAKIASVSEGVLNTFFGELAKADELGDIAANLKKLVLTDGVFAEPAIKAALFPDAP